MATALRFILELVVLGILFYMIILVFHELTKSRMRKHLEGYGFRYIKRGRYLIEIPNPIIIDFNLKAVDLMNGTSYQFKQPVEDDEMIDLFAHAMKDSGMIFQLKDELRDLVVSRCDDVICWKLNVD